MIYSRRKLELLGAVTECLRNESGTAIYSQNFWFSHASVSGKGNHATENIHITLHIIMIIAFIDMYGANGFCCKVVDAVLGKTTLLVANFGIFKYQQVFINV